MAGAVRLRQGAAEDPSAWASARPLGSLLKRPQTANGERRFIPSDSPVDLASDNPIAHLGKDDLFGEMTCRTYQPRSATVEARESCVMVEMLRVILDMLVGSRQPSDAAPG